MPKPITPSTLHLFVCLFVCFWRDSHQWAKTSSFTRFLDHTQRRTTVRRTPLDKWSARRRDLYLTTQNSQQTKIHAPGGIQTHNISRRAAADLRLRPRGHCDRLYITLHHHHHHVPEGLGVFPVPWSSRWSWSLHLFLGRPMFLYCSACFGSLCPSSVRVVATFGSLSVSILCTCCSHFW